MGIQGERPWAWKDKTRTNINPPNAMNSSRKFFHNSRRTKRIRTRFGVLAGPIRERKIPQTTSPPSRLRYTRSQPPPHRRRRTTHSHCDRWHATQPREFPLNRAPQCVVTRPSDPLESRPVPLSTHRFHRLLHRCRTRSTPRGGARGDNPSIMRRPLKNSAPLAAAPAPAPAPAPVPAPHPNSGSSGGAGASGGETMITKEQEAGAYTRAPLSST